MSKVISKMRQYEYNITNYKYEDFEDQLDEDNTACVMPTIDFNVDKNRIIRQIMAEKSIEEIINILFEVKGRDVVVSYTNKFNNDWEILIT